jgi:hypothetical protein
LEEEAKSQRSARFIGFIEPYDYGWRASFRTLRPNEVFTREGDSEVFATELEAVKWLHEQANSRGFSSIKIRTKTDPLG